MNNDLRIDLQIFTESEKDFFTNAFNEAYNIGEEESASEGTPEPPQEPESVPDEPSVEEPAKTEEPPKEPSKDEIKEMYEKYFGKPEPTHQEKEPEYPEEVQTALELYKYLESNPHLVEAMRGVDQEGYEKLQESVPDDVHRKLSELEDYVQEQKYNQYISELKSKFDDFDEDKVLEYAEEHEVYDLEVAYKAMKSEEKPETNLDELREQIRKEIKEELLKELKENSQSTNSIIGGSAPAPATDNEVKLTAKEARVARGMGLTPTEYAQWK